MYNKVNTMIVSSALGEEINNFNATKIKKSLFFYLNFTDHTLYQIKAKFTTAETQPRSTSKCPHRHHDNSLYFRWQLNCFLPRSRRTERLARRCEDARALWNSSAFWVASSVSLFLITALLLSNGNKYHQDETLSKHFSKATDQGERIHVHRR